MMRAREPAVAGMFYPEDPAALRRTVQGYLDAADARPGAAPKAIVVPHAGYVYSGPIAASAYARLLPRRGEITRVILLGPSHRVPFQGLARTGVERFLTPLGGVTVDPEAYALLDDLPQVRLFEAPFEGEHCLEVQLPFLQACLDDFRIVPFVVGDAETEEVAQVIERLWGGDETLILVSSDLSHYLDYDSARSSDVQTSRAIEALEPNAIGHHQACGCMPLRGLLRAAQRRGLQARTLDLRSSGDTAGPRSRVVGYGAYAFS